MAPPDEITLDEIVAGNVRRLRAERDWEVADLAEQMGCPRHLIYDMERPRKGQTQRAFSWSDLVGLCVAFRTNLFELVLPGEGVDVVIGGQSALEVAPSDQTPALQSFVDHLVEVGFMVGAQIRRDELGLMLFGVPGNSLSPEVLKTFAKTQERGLAERVGRLEEILTKYLVPKADQEEE